MRKQQKSLRGYFILPHPVVIVASSYNWLITSYGWLAGLPPQLISAYSLWWVLVGYRWGYILHVEKQDNGTLMI